MKNTIIFDLDGTLLPMDNDLFLKTYISSISQFFSQDIDPNRFAKALLEASELTIMDNTPEKNETTYMKYFGELLGVDPNTYHNKFYDYYKTTFDICKKTTSESKEMKKAVSILKEKGYDLVIATNPLLPLISNLKRIKWAGLNTDDFIHITSFESCTSCKPRKAFYQEVLTNINKSPEECIMIGNDTRDDLSIMQLGVETYLITDCIIEHNEQTITPTYRGTYKDFLQFTKELKSL